MISPKAHFLCKARVMLGIALLTLVGLFSTVQLNKPTDQILKKFTGISEITPSKLQGLFEQARSIKDGLPAHGWINFDTDNRTFFDRNTILEHALAPLIFDNDPSHLWWVGRYEFVNSKANIMKKYNLKEIQEVGQTLVILKRKDS